jgi:hypothetical protein
MARFPVSGVRMTTALKEQTANKRREYIVVKDLGVGRFRKFGIATETAPSGWGSGKRASITGWSIFVVLE